jgi:hypothetical protein
MRFLLRSINKLFQTGSQICQPQQAQQLEQNLQGALVLPSVAPDVADDEPPNFEEYCKKLHHFFKERVFGKNQTMSWSLEENLPRLRKDTEFDKLLQTLRLLKK